MRTPGPPWFVGAAVAGLLLAGGCAPPSRPTPTTATLQAETPEPVVTESASLEVENNSVFDVRVFLIRAGQFIRLGTVTSMTTTSFQLTPHHISREIQFYADPIGASIRRNQAVGSTGRQKTDAFRIRPGQQVQFKLEKLMRSHVIAVY